MKIRFAIVIVLLISMVWPVHGDDKPLSGAVIVVDPGHGGQTYSKSYTGGTKGIRSRLTESELNLRVSFELAKILKEAGATVSMTRTADHRMSREGSSNVDELHARIDFFEHANPHFFLSVHHNAADKPEASGHTSLYKHNAKDDTLYESIATLTNEALDGAVPGPKRKLIKGNYHILRETDIPGTITESGFMTNPAFDELCNKPEYAAKEAAAIAKGAIRFWQTHQAALVSLRDLLAKERAAKPRDPNSFTATELNPKYQEKMTKRLAKIAPEGNYRIDKVKDYLTAYKAEFVNDPAAVFTVSANVEKNVIVLTGESSIRKYHDEWIDILVAMKLYSIRNEIVIGMQKKK